MTTNKGATGGTVAARIDALQDIATDTYIPRRPGPRIISTTFEPNVVIGHGRRSESSFASPASRTPHDGADGADGARGDSRPPMGSLDLEDDPLFVRTTSSLKHPSPSRIMPQSQLTLDGKYDDPFVDPSMGASPPAKKSDSDLRGARARLRPVSARRERGKGKAPENTTMAELGHMLDSAIIEQSSDASPIKSAVAGPRSPFQRSRSVRAGPRTNELGQAQAHEQGTSQRLTHRPPTGARDQPASSPIRAPLPLASPRSPTRSSQQPQSKARAYSNASIGIPNRCVSPVKQRTALFESLSSSPPEAIEPAQPPPRAHLHRKDGWVTIPGHFPTPEVEARLHRLKFGQSIDVQSDIAEGPTSSRDDEAYETAQESERSPVVRASSRHDHRRAPSRGWPSHTPVSTKTGISHPQQTDEAASPSVRDAHQPLARPSIVSQRIAQLALAGLESEQVPSRSHSVANSRSRHTAAASATVVESEVREHALDGSMFRPSLLPPLQVPVQEEVDDLRAHPQEYGDTEASRMRARATGRTREATQTPVSLGMFEKQAVQPTRQPFGRMEAGSPSTPTRGRSQARRTPRSSGYGVEQSFYFSPTRSRSQSKASGRRLTLEINLGTPDREAMEKVVIKADMDVLEEN